MNLIEDRTIALAGVVQACKQVQNLARTGQVEQADFEASLQSVLVLDAISSPAVYGGLQGIRGGLSLLERGIVTSPVALDVEVLRYVASVLALQSQLYRDDRKFNEFGTAIERLSSFSAEDLVEACSEVYQKHVSVLQPQIIVQGESGFLQNTTIPPKIRSLLLAALRSAVLWQQKDGGRFRLLWERTRMRNMAKELLQQISVH